jgi:uncharacterized protein YndB with AHSA1/START domain
MLKIVEAVEIDAPPEIVFHSISEPSELLSWWGDPDVCQAVEWKFEPRMGGLWSSRFRTISTGGEFTMKGEILAFEPPHRLEYTWRDSRFPGTERTRVRFDLIAIAGGTRITVTHSGFVGDTPEYREYSGGWSGVLAGLRMGVEAKPTSRGTND